MPGVTLDALGFSRSPGVALGGRLIRECSSADSQWTWDCWNGGDGVSLTKGVQRFAIGVEGRPGFPLIAPEAELSGDQARLVIIIRTQDNEPASASSPILPLLEGPRSATVEPHSVLSGRGGEENPRETRGHRCTSFCVHVIPSGSPGGECRPNCKPKTPLCLELCLC